MILTGTWHLFSARAGVPSGLFAGIMQPLTATAGRYCDSLARLLSHCSLLVPNVDFQEKETIMVRSNSLHLVPELPSSPQTPLLPKQPYVSAVTTLSSKVTGVHALFDSFGRVRTLTAEDPLGMFDQSYAGDPVLHAGNFVASVEASKTLGLQYAEFFGAAQCHHGDHHCVEFMQKLTVDEQSYRVRNGFVHVYMDATGAIFRVNSSVRHGRKPASLDGIITADEAVEAARLYIGVDSFEKQRTELVMSAHKDRFDPCYEVTVTTHAPRRVACLLVKATSGEVVYVENKLKTFQGDKPIKVDDTASAQKASTGRRPRRPRPRPTPPVVVGPVKGRTFLEIPDPKAALPQQVHDAVLSALPDPGVLKNDNLVVYLGSKKREVKCKADGTFNYKPGEPEFAAVVTFFAYNAQMELLKSWGLKAPSAAMPVYVEDPNVRDNAYFDPENMEIHIGVGSGLPFGLNRYIAYDMGVTWHENGHHVVYLQTPGQDLPGDEGGAIHESTGDVLGDLLMDWWFKIEYATELKKTLTLADVNADDRIIGKYALPGQGIRQQKNKKRTPQDKTGEVHDDGLISGGAQADLLVALMNSSTSMKAGMELYGRMTLKALTLVPKHKVTFVDLLDAHITADQRDNSGANKGAIVKAFADHGIVLKKGGGRGGIPLIFLIS